MFQHQGLNQQILDTPNLRQLISNKQQLKLRKDTNLFPSSPGWNEESEKNFILMVTTTGPSFDVSKPSTNKNSDLEKSCETLLLNQTEPTEQPPESWAFRERKTVSKKETESVVDKTSFLDKVIGEYR